MLFRLPLPASGLWLGLALLAPALAGQEGAGVMVDVPAGAYVPQYAAGATTVEVEAFRVDRTPVTVGDYLAFVRERPSWRRGRVPGVFADGGYLASWLDELEPAAAADRPITEVSWFAARAYCEWRGARLATTREWEYLALASETEVDAWRDEDFNRRLLALQQARRRGRELPPVGETFRNALGVWDLHGLVWEWTEDFNSQMATGSARNDAGLDRGLFCAAGSVGATDTSDYAAFLRWSHRASLAGTTTGTVLGFRCAAPLDGGR